MHCCTSARGVKTSDRFIEQPTSVQDSNKIEPEHDFNKSREPVQILDSPMQQEHQIPVHSAYRRGSEEEFESTTDVEAAFLVVSQSLDSYITSKERLLRALYITGRHPSKKQISALWKEYADDNGLDFKLFKRICKEEPLPSKDDIIKVFEQLDRNRSGYIDVRELEIVLTTRGEKMTKEEFKKLLTLLNISSNGSIHYGDFCDNIVMTTHDCREASRRNRVQRLRDPVAVYEAEPRSVNRSASGKPHLTQTASVRSTSKDREITEQQQAIQQQLSKRYPNSLFCKLIDPSHATRPKLPKLDSWNDLAMRGYFILDDPSKGGFITSTYTLVVKKETKLYANVEIAKSQRLSDRLLKLDIGFYIVNEPSDGRSGSIHISEFGFGEAHGVCTLLPGKYLLLPYTTGCILKDQESSSKSKSAEQRGQRPKSNGSGSPPKLVQANGKLSKELMDCIEDVFRLFDLDGDNYLSKHEFSCYYRNSEDENLLDDNAWNAVLERSEAEGQKLSFANFAKLFELELDDADDDSLEDLVIGLNNLGISRHLILEEACGYNINVFYESMESDVKLFGGQELSSMSGPIREAIISETVSEGVELPCRQLADVGAAAYVFTDDRHAKVVVRYKSPNKTRLQLRLDASESVACMFASGSGSLRSKDGNSAGGQRSVVMSTISSNTTVPVLFAVPTHPERMAELVIGSIEILQP